MRRDGKMCLGMMECVGDLHSQRNAETMKIKGKGTHLHIWRGRGKVLRTAAKIVIERGMTIDDVRAESTTDSSSLWIHGT